MESLNNFIKNNVIHANPTDQPTPQGGNAKYMGESIDYDNIYDKTIYVLSHMKKDNKETQDIYPILNMLGFYNDSFNEKDWRIVYEAITNALIEFRQDNYEKPKTNDREGFELRILTNKEGWVIDEIHKDIKEAENVVSCYDYMYYDILDYSHWDYSKPDALVQWDEKPSVEDHAGFFAYKNVGAKRKPIKTKKH